MKIEDFIVKHGNALNRRKFEEVLGVAKDELTAN